MRRYLIVDDNAAFAENLAEILRDQGAEATVVDGGASAIAAVRASLAEQRPFDALLSDMRMPGMGGARLVHAARALDPALPAMVVTAYTDDDDLEAARHEGLVAVLPKPVPIARLIELLGEARRDGLLVVVEDDPALLDNLCEALRSRGYGAVTASSVLETSRLGGLRPFCALVDLRVPGGPDGAAMRLVAERYPDMPLLVLTAHAVDPSLTPARVFHKPFDTEGLLAEVDRLHGAPRSGGPPGREVAA